MSRRLEGAEPLCGRRAVGMFAVEGSAIHLFWMMSEGETPAFVFAEFPNFFRGRVDSDLRRHSRYWLVGERRARVFGSRRARGWRMPW
jgi:hypothetical protein